MIKGLHHSAYRCRDSEETRKFYEDFLGLRLAGALDIHETKTGRKSSVLHTFFQFDLHIALEVDEPTLMAMFAKGKERGIETRGVADHGMVHSIYFRDPNGYVIELTAKMPGHDEAMNPSTNGAHAILDKWQAAKFVDAPS